MKSAIIVGCKGQDGTYLSENLLDKGYKVIGIDKSYFYDYKAKMIGSFNILDAYKVDKLLSKVQPDEIYYFAAVHQSAEEEIYDSRAMFKLSMEVHVDGLNIILGSIVKHCPQSKLFYAASSHLFSGKSDKKQDENTPRQPSCIYSITKSAGVDICIYYRQEHCIYCSIGYLYNHESPLRDSRFVSKRIVNTAVKIKYGFSDKLILGNLDAFIDWGYAPDYAEAMVRILQLETALDFIISSGEIHTLKDFVKGVFEYLNLDWKKYVEVDATLIKKSAKYLHGNNAKICKLTGWQPTVAFDELIKIMVNEEIKKFEQ